MPRAHRQRVVTASRPFPSPARPVLLCRDSGYSTSEVTHGSHVHMCTQVQNCHPWTESNNREEFAGLSSLFRGYTVTVLCVQLLTLLLAHLAFR